MSKATGTSDDQPDVTCNHPATRLRSPKTTGTNLLPKVAAGEKNTISNLSAAAQSGIQDAIMGFLYELPQQPDNFTENLLLLLGKYFGFRNIIFLYYKELHNLSNLFDNRTLFTDCIDQYVENGVLLPKPKTFNDKLFLCSPLSHDELPGECKNKKVVLSSQLPKDIRRDKKFADFHQFFKLRSQEHFASVNLFYPEGEFLGRVEFSKSAEEGDFTDKEVYILESIAKHVAYQYYAAIDYYYKIERIRLFEQCYSHLKIGILAVDSNMQVFCGNQSSLPFCQDIVGGRPVDTRSKVASKHITQQRVVDLLHEDLSSLLNHGTKRLVGASFVYSVKVTSFVISDYKNDLKAHYIFYVNRYINDNANAFEQFVQQYNLSSREAEIINLLEVGYSAQKISDELYISQSTVKTHISNIFKKVQVGNRAALLYKLNAKDTSAQQ